MRVEGKKETPNVTQSQPNANPNIKKILLPIVTLGVLQPLQHVSNGWGGGRALSYGEYIQTACVLLVQLDDCRDLVADGIPDRLERRPEGRREGGRDAWMGR